VPGESPRSKLPDTVLRKARLVPDEAGFLVAGFPQACNRPEKPEEEQAMPDASTNTSDIATPELMKAISAAFNSRDVDRIVSFFTDDATFWLARGPEPVGRTLAGKETIRQTLAARFKVIPDMRWDHKEYIYAGNRAISVWTVKGKGADGEDLNYQGCDIYTFRGGKICAKDTYWKIVEQKDRL
jgi:ketosteroid isomerase-like protein